MVQGTHARTKRAPRSRELSLAEQATSASRPPLKLGSSDLAKSIAELHDVIPEPTVEMPLQAVSQNDLAPQDTILTIGIHEGQAPT